ASISVAGLAQSFHDATAYAPGGQVTLKAVNGNVALDTDSRIDFSGASGGGDAGALNVSAINGTLIANGTLQGQGTEGSASGRFGLDAGSIPTSSALNGTLEVGNVDGLRSLRARTGDIKVAQNDSVHATTINLFADAGSVDIAGTLIADRNSASHSSG